MKESQRSGHLRLVRPSMVGHTEPQQPLVVPVMPPLRAEEVDGERWMGSLWTFWR